MTLRPLRVQPKDLKCYATMIVLLVVVQEVRARVEDVLGVEAGGRWER